MPHSSQAKKRDRQNTRRKLFNKSRRSSLRTQIKKFEDALTRGEVAAAETELRLATKRIDKAIKAGLIHRNMGSRKKAQLASRLNTLRQTAAAS